MTALPTLAAWSLRLIAAAALIALLLMAFRWLRARSPLIAGLFAFGVIVRAGAGVVLFLASTYEWPILPHLQLGGGFWTLALDAQSYYAIAADASMHGLGVISDGSPSPFYTRMLALCMMLFGMSPLVGVVLNVTCYAASVALLAYAAGLTPGGTPASARSVAVAVAALTLSPAMLIFATQPLKEQLSALVVIAALAGAGIWFNALADGVQRRERLAAGGTLLLLSVYALSGIRPYAVVFFLGTLAIAGVYHLRFSGHSRVGRVAMHGALLAVLVTTFVAGAGDYYVSYRTVLTEALERGTALASFDVFRQGFVASGGATATASGSATATAMADAATPDAAAATLSRGSDSETGIEKLESGKELSGVSRARSLARGLAIMLLPISLLRAAGVVDFHGGAGLLWVTDLDTVVLGLTLILTAYFLVVRLRHERLSPAALCALILGVTLTLSMAYVVTNYGTLFRLRWFAVAPFWAVLALLPAPRAVPSGAVETAPTR